MSLQVLPGLSAPARPTRLTAFCGYRMVHHRARGANRLARNVQEPHRSEAGVSGTTFDSIPIHIIAD